MKRICSFASSMTLVIFFFFLSSQANAQVSFKIGGGGGFIMPMGDYKGESTDYFAGTNYGLSNGFGLNAKARVGLVGFNLTGEIGYAFLSNEGDAVPGQGTLEVSHRILSVKVGPEYRLGLPAVPVTPYLGVNISLNSFSGSTTFKGVSGVSSGTFDLNGATRIGAGATIGVMISSIDIAVHYNLHNLTGNTWEGGDNRLDTYKSLNDDKDPAYAVGDTKHVVKDARSIQTLVLSVSVMFGI